jgi:hypothetical protein
MKTIREIYCTKCGKKQTNNVEDLLKADLFWRLCESCGRYGLTVVTRRKATLREYIEALFFTYGFGVVQTEASLKDLLKNRDPL